MMSMPTMMMKGIMGMVVGLMMMMALMVGDGDGDDE